MSKIFNFEKFLEVNEMYSLKEVDAPGEMAKTMEILKNKKGMPVIAVKAEANKKLPEPTDKVVYVSLIPTNTEFPETDIQFEKGLKTFLFTQKSFKEGQGGVDINKKNVATPDQIEKSGYGLLWHLTSFISDSTAPEKQDFVDTINVLKELRGQRDFKLVVNKNTNFKKFIASIVQNQFNPSVASGAGTFAKIPMGQPETTKVLAMMAEAVKEVKLV